MELAALPGRAGQDGLAGDAEARVIVAGDEPDAVEATISEAHDELAPVYFSLGERHRETQHAALAILTDPDRREDGGVANHAAHAHLFITGVEKEIRERAERAGPPCLQFLVEQGCRAADLRRGQAFQPELDHHLFHVARGHALNVHPGNGEHDGTGRAPAPFQRLRIERRFAAAALGNLQCERARGGVESLGLVAVGIAATFGRALIGPRPQMLLALNTHGEIEKRREHARHPVRPKRSAQQEITDVRMHHR